MMARTRGIFSEFILDKPSLQLDVVKNLEINMCFGLIYITVPYKETALTCSYVEARRIVVSCVLVAVG